MQKKAVMLRDWILITGAWAIFQLVFLWFNGGINNKEEAVVYSHLADSVYGGDFHFRLNFYLYAGYIAILVVLKLVGLSYNWMYAVQLLASLLSLICLVKILSAALRSRPAIITSALLYCSCPFIQTWVSYLYTDSLFASLLMIGLFFLFFQEVGMKYKAGLWATMILLPFFRPVGFIFIIITLFYWLFYSARKNWPAIVSALAWLVFVCLFTIYSFKTSPDFFYAGHNASANVICGLTGDLVRYIEVPYTKDMSLAGYFISNPTMTFYLFTQRLFKAYWLTRPYYTNLHNTVIVLLLAGYYFLAATGLVVPAKKMHGFRRTLFVGMLLFTGPIVLLCADWNNRFSLPLLVFLFLFIGIGADFWLEKIKTWRSG